MCKLKVKCQQQQQKQRKVCRNREDSEPNWSLNFNLGFEEIFFWFKTMWFLIIFYVNKRF